MTWQLYHAGSTKAKGSSGVHSSQSNHERDELWKAKIEKNSSTLFTTETPSTRMHGEPVELRISDCGLRIADCGFPAAASSPQRHEDDKEAPR